MQQMSPGSFRLKRGARSAGPRLLSLKRSRRAEKKFDAVFEMPNGRRKTVAFGASGYKDFTMHHDPERRRRYIQRHARREPFTDPTKPGTLSRFILWEGPTVSGSLRAYRKRFGV